MAPTTYTQLRHCNYTHAAALWLFEVTISSALEPNLPESEYNEEARVPQHQPQPATEIVHRNKRLIRSLCKMLTRMFLLGSLQWTRFRYASDVHFLLHHRHCDVIYDIRYSVTFSQFLLQKSTAHLNHPAASGETAFRIMPPCALPYNPIHSCSY